MLKFIQGHSDWSQAIGLNILSIGISFTSLESELKISLLVISILYTLWRWYRDFKKSKS